MAVFKPSTAIKTLQGSFGSVTTVKNWAGQEILKEKITQTTNVNSAGQVKQRGRLGFTSSLAKLFVLLIAKKINRQIKQTPKGPVAIYPRNIFVSENIDVIYGEGGVDDFTPSLIFIGAEDLTNPAFTAVTLGTDGVIDATITDNSTVGNASNTDVLCLCVIDADGIPHYYPDERRTGGTVELTPATEPVSGTAFFFALAITEAEFTAAGESVQTVFATKSEYVSSQIICLGSRAIV